MPQPRRSRQIRSSPLIHRPQNRKPRHQPVSDDDSASGQETESGPQTRLSMPTHGMTMRSRKVVPGTSASKRDARQRASVLPTSVQEEDGVDDSSQLRTFPRNFLSPEPIATSIRMIQLSTAINHASEDRLEAPWYGVWSLVLDHYFSVVLQWRRSPKATVMLVYPQYRLKAGIDEGNIFFGTLASAEELVTSIRASMPPVTPGEDPIDLIEKTSARRIPVTLSSRILDASSSITPATPPRRSEPMLEPSSSPDPLNLIDALQTPLQSSQTPLQFSQMPPSGLGSPFVQVVSRTRNIKERVISPEGAEPAGDNRSADDIAVPYIRKGRKIVLSPQSDMQSPGESHVTATQHELLSEDSGSVGITSGHTGESDLATSSQSPPEASQATVNAQKVLEDVVDQWQKAKSHTTRIPDFVLRVSEVSVSSRKNLLPFALHSTCFRQRDVLLVEAKVPPKDKHPLKAQEALFEGIINNADGQITEQVVQAFRANPDVSVIATLTVCGPWFCYEEFSRSDVIIPDAEDSEYVPSPSPGAGAQRDGEDRSNPRTTVQKALEEIFRPPKKSLRAITQRDAPKIMDMICQRLQEISVEYWPQTQEEIPDLE